MINDTFKYRSIELAKYIIAYANKNMYAINMTKLQKLLYIVYGTSLAIYNERIIDEHPQAWPYGPVFPTTRNKLLKEVFEEITFDDADVVRIKDDTRTKQIVAAVFRAFGRYNAGTLSAWSHQPNSPWERTTLKDGFKWGDRIDDESIRVYFDSNIIRHDQKEE